MGIIVQKYGGTSLRNLGSNSGMLKHVRECVDEGHKLVIVVSAIGKKGEPYATDTLIEQLYKLGEKVDPKKKDLIMSCGEMISTAMVSHLLEVEGLPSEPLVGFQAGIITDNHFNSSNIIHINVDNIMKHLNKRKIAVIAGFQGVTEELDITTLGRGGSDTTAVALGAFLKADRVDIYTDVPGLALIDPNLVDNAKYIKNISYDHMYNLALNGVKVIHPTAVSIGKNFSIPIRLLSTFEDSPGTFISEVDHQEKIMGITINNGENYATLSLFFKKEFKDEVIKDLEKYSKENKNNLLDVQYLEDRIKYIVKNKYVVSFAQKLYNFLIK